MTGMTAVLPIIILILLIVLFILLSRRSYAVFPKLFYGKRIRWTVTGYVVVLLVATFVFYIMPEPDSMEQESGMNDEDIDGWAIASQIHSAASNGTVGEEFDQYIVQDQEIEVTDDTYNLNQANGEPVFVFIKEKDENDGVVDATLYQTPTVIGGIDISDDIPSMNMETNPTEATLTVPEHPELEFIAYQTEFPITQFTGGDNWMHPEIQKGDNLLLVQIPRDLRLTYSTNMDVTFTDDE